MNPRNKLIKEKPNLQSVADVNINDEHSSLDELSVDKENYFTETFPIDVYCSDFRMKKNLRPLNKTTQSAKQ